MEAKQKISKPSYSHRFWNGCPGSPPGFPGSLKKGAVTLISSPSLTASNVSCTGGWSMFVPFHDLVIWKCISDYPDNLQLNQRTTIICILNTCNKWLSGQGGSMHGWDMATPSSLAKCPIHIVLPSNGQMRTMGGPWIWGVFFLGGGVIFFSKIQRYPRPQMDPEWIAVWLKPCSPFFYFALWIKSRD